MMTSSLPFCLHLRSTFLNFHLMVLGVYLGLNCVLFCVTLSVTLLLLLSCLILHRLRGFPPFPLNIVECVFCYFHDYHKSSSKIILLKVKRTQIFPREEKGAWGF